MISQKSIKLIGINLAVLLFMLLIIESTAYIGRVLMGAPSVGWVLSKSTLDLESDCYRMLTHPILSHVHDHKNKCKVRGGYASGTFVHYDENYNNDDPILVTLGGSTTDGLYDDISDGYTFPYLLDLLFKDSGENIHVVNGGVGMYSSKQELLKLITEVSSLNLNIKYIVSLNGINDIKGYAKASEIMKEKSPFLTEILYKMYREQIWIIQNKNPSTLLPSTFSLISYMLRISHKSGANVSIVKQNIFSKFTSPKTEAGLWFKNISLMRAVSKTMGAEYIVYLQPTMGLSGIQSLVKSDTPDGRMYIDAKNNNPKYFQDLNETYTEMKNICKGLSYCFDISNIAPPIGQMYNDPRHHNKYGNKLIAEEIFSHFK